MRDAQRHHSGTNFAKAQKNYRSVSRLGFTIVELLIVVVVIAILAAITLVAYNGITANARESALKTDLTTTAKKIGIAQAETGSYPSAKPSDLPGTIQYTGGGATYCATASKDGIAFHITEAGTIQSGACSGHTIAGGGGGNEIAANSPIQDVTSAQCQALPTFTGSNSDAVRTVTDNRDGTTRTYEIAKLADGKCWMLTNLKLGSASGTITLTPEDSDVESTFVLPQLISGGYPSYGPPQVVAHYGGTGSGSTNYGYLYNWYAATAGASDTTMPAGSGDATNSICPANWRLPSGGAWNDPANELSTLNAYMAGLTGVNDVGYTSSNSTSAANAANWRYSGAFRGVYAGDWWASDEGFYGAGSYGRLWSRTAHQSSSSRALYQGFSSSFVGTGSADSGRNTGAAVRCLLN